ncbi:hypothetical protein AK812_SmicGene10072 [Symbiodinium microadriaticum]|uniref:Uncharacterized protein n=1 Tax=Symbiodinium microadriaticum TaxID=2951 RepID=A0A1Q9EGR5_SYMMI|nr:hypothetical protein AK812_SmicGene10072 [Symbiodinium microadriaticum]CAE7377643.1 unnamed protein product [Symbiodinium sp. KB8]
MWVKVNGWVWLPDNAEIIQQQDKSSSSKRVWEDWSQRGWKSDNRTTTQEGDSATSHEEAEDDYPAQQKNKHQKMDYAEAAHLAWLDGKAKEFENKLAELTGRRGRNPNAKVMPALDYESQQFFRPSGMGMLWEGRPWINFYAGSPRPTARLKGKAARTIKGGILTWMVSDKCA